MEQWVTTAHESKTVIFNSVLEVQLQSNKAVKAVEQFDWIHSVDSLKLATRLDGLLNVKVVASV